jgi:TolA-binding protein
MDDGEAFVLTDWSERIRRVQFDRKETFDAGATPGLDDFERPELKSVSSDLVQDLEAISEAEEQRESRIQELERKLADKNERIEELEAELQEAKDLSKMAERFSRAMIEHASGRAFRTDVTVGTQTEMDDWRKQALRGEHVEATRRPANPTDEYLEAEAEARAEVAAEEATDAETETNDDPVPDEPQTETTAPPGWPEEADGEANDGTESGSGSAPDGSGNSSAGSTAAEIDAAFEALTGAEEATTERDGTAEASRDDPTTGETSPTESEPVTTESEPGGEDGTAGSATGVPGADGGADGWPEFGADAPDAGTTTDESSTVETVVEESDPGFEREVVREVKATIRGFDEVTRRMLAHYREQGACDPVDAHVAAGGDGNRTRAYSRNRTLRQADLVAHAGRGRYGCRLAAYLREAHGGRLSEAELTKAVEAAETAFVEDRQRVTGSGTETETETSPEPATTDPPEDEPAPAGESTGETGDAGAEVADDVLAPDDDAEFIDAEAVQADEESAVGASTTALDDDPADVPRGTEDVDPDQSVVDASGDGHDQFQPPEERTASDGGESDDFPKWPGE